MQQHIHNLVQLMWMHTSIAGQQYAYSSDSIHADDPNITTIVYDGDQSTCLTFLGGVGGVGPWYTHVIFSNQQQAPITVNVTGHALGCGRSLILGLHPENVTEFDGGTQRGKQAKCALLAMSSEGDVEMCAYRCSCPVTNCGRLDIIHRPMSNQPSSWQLCGLDSGKFIYFH